MLSRGTASGRRRGRCDSRVSWGDIAERGIENFRTADEDYGERSEVAVQALRG